VRTFEVSISVVKQLSSGNWCPVLYAAGAWREVAMELVADSADSENRSAELA
jgi:hypothetical protein